MRIKRSNGTSDKGAARTEHSGGIWRDTLRRFGRNKVAIICLVIFLVICISCALAPYLTKYNYASIDADIRLQKPS